MCESHQRDQSKEKYENSRRSPKCKQQKLSKMKLNEFHFGSIALTQGDPFDNHRQSIIQNFFDQITPDKMQRSRIRQKKTNKKKRDEIYKIPQHQRSRNVFLSFIFWYLFFCVFVVILIQSTQRKRSTQTQTHYWAHRPAKPCT